MNWIDISVIGIVLVSGIFAFMRGFVSAMLSVAGWIGAGFATLYVFPHIRPYMQAHVEPAVLADGMSVVGVFIVSLTVLTVISQEIARIVRGSSLSAVDRSLGFVFGILRGVVLVSLAWLVTVWLVTPEGMPEVLAQAKTRPFAEAGSQLLVSLVPSKMRQNAIDSTQSAAEEVKRTMEDETLRRLTTTRTDVPKPAGTPATPEPAYGRQDRNDLNRLTGTVH